MSSQLELQLPEEELLMAVEMPGGEETNPDPPSKEADPTAAVTERERSKTRPSNYRTNHRPDKSLPPIFVPLGKNLRWIVEQWASIGDAVGITEICRQAVEWLNWDDQSDHIDEMREGLYLSVDWRQKASRRRGSNNCDGKKIQMVGTCAMHETIAQLKEKTGNNNRSEIVREAILRYLLACMAEEPPVYYPALRNRLFPAFKQLTEFSLRNVGICFDGYQAIATPNMRAHPKRTGMMIQKKIAESEATAGFDLPL